MFEPSNTTDIDSAIKALRSYKSLFIRAQKARDKSSAANYSEHSERYIQNAHASCAEANHLLEQGAYYAHARCVELGLAQPFHEDVYSRPREYHLGQMHSYYWKIERPVNNK